MDLHGSDEDEENLCPICAEEMDLTDQNFKPCTCGYQMCRFCWHQINENSGKCPACRQLYNQQNFSYTPPDPELLQKMLAERKAKAKLKKQQSAHAHPQVAQRRNLSNVRVVQRNLVYVTNIPIHLAKEETLKRHEYFGQYGKILKIVANRNNVFSSGGGTATPTVGAYITFAKKEEAGAAINVVDGATLEGKILRASFGTTKYCTYFLRGIQCTNPDCMYLHELGGDKDTFSKEDMNVGKHFHETTHLPAKVPVNSYKGPGLPPPRPKGEATAPARTVPVWRTQSTPNALQNEASSPPEASVLSTSPPLRTSLPGSTTPTLATVPLAPPPASSKDRSAHSPRASSLSSLSPEPSVTSQPTVAKASSSLATVAPVSKSSQGTVKQQYVPTGNKASPSAAANTSTPSPAAAGPTVPSPSLTPSPPASAAAPVKRQNSKPSSRVQTAVWAEKEKSPPQPKADGPPKDNPTPAPSSSAALPSSSTTLPPASRLPASTTSAPPPSPFFSKEEPTSVASSVAASILSNSEEEEDEADNDLLRATAPKPLPRQHDMSELDFESFSESLADMLLQDREIESSKVLSMLLRFLTFQAVPPPSAAPAPPSYDWVANLKTLLPNVKINVASSPGGQAPPVPASQAPGALPAPPPAAQTLWGGSNSLFNWSPTSSDSLWGPPPSSSAHSTPTSSTSNLLPLARSSGSSLPDANWPRDSKLSASFAAQNAAPIQDLEPEKDKIIRRPQDTNGQKDERRRSEDVRKEKEAEETKRQAEEQKRRAEEERKVEEERKRDEERKREEEKQRLEKKKDEEKKREDERRKEEERKKEEERRLKEKEDREHEERERKPAGVQRSQETVAARGGPAKNTTPKPIARTVAAPASSIAKPAVSPAPVPKSSPPAPSAAPASAPAYTSNSNSTPKSASNRSTPAVTSSTSARAKEERKEEEYPVAKKADGPSPAFADPAIMTAGKAHSIADERTHSAPSQVPGPQPAWPYLQYRPYLGPGAAVPPPPGFGPGAPPPPPGFAVPPPPPGFASPSPYVPAPPPGFGPAPYAPFPPVFLPPHAGAPKGLAPYPFMAPSLVPIFPAPYTAPPQQHHPSDEDDRNRKARGRRPSTADKESRPPLDHN